MCGSLIYWLCGFVSSVTNFLLFETFLFLSNLTFAAWFFFVAAASPNVEVAEPLGMLSILFYVIFAGYLVTKGHIPDFLIWLYWPNPISWVFRGLSVLQFRHEDVDVCVYKGIDYCSLYGKTMGEYFLASYDIPSEKVWIWLALGYLVVAHGVFMTMTY